MIDKPLGHYQVLEKIGAGGMGEVYRGRDTRLNRDVAIKVLPESLAADPERLARFDREAEALAALNHPNIAIVHTVVDRAIIMELVGGEDLSERIARGPLPVSDALPIARQVAEALAAAHDAGIIHRDLKPANIKVTDAGLVKVLDFGLAKAIAPPGADASSLAGADVADSPTQSAGAFGPGHGPGTQLGAILGTAAYMSPEQIRGKGVDKRADVWAFGCVLFEMLTGKRAFAGDDIADTLALVLTKEPAWDLLPSATPPRITELLHRCLTRNPHLRLRDIGDARFEIDDAIARKPVLSHQSQPIPAPVADVEMRPAASKTPIAGPKTGPAYKLETEPAYQVPKPAAVSEEPTVEAPAAARSMGRPIFLVIAALLAGIAIGGAIVWRLPRAAAQTTSPTGVVQATVPVAPADEFNAGRAYAGIGGARTGLAWSPDGRMLAFIGRQGSGPSKVYVRDLSADAARPLDGTDGAEHLTFSPDGREIAFASNGAIRRTPVAGGPITKICDARWVNGMSWGATRFVYADEGPLMQVSLDGGKVEPLTQPSGPERHSTPQLLPGDTAVMFTQHEKRWTSGDERVMVQKLPGGTPVVLIPDGADARLLSTGQIAFLRQGTLFVADFDATALKIGSTRAITKDVAQVVMSGISQDLTLAGQFAVSATGTLAYVASPLVTRPDAEIVGLDRTGKISTLSNEPGTYQLGSSVSTDGRVALSMTTDRERRPYAFDLARGTLTPLVPPGKAEFVGRVWSSTNKVAFLAYEGASEQLVIVNADRPSEIERVPGGDEFWPSAWSADGTRLLGSKKRDIWIYSATATPKFQPVLETPAVESHASWSPDGRWLAYVSDTSGRPEVYVRPYPGPGRDTQVSTGGGSAASWSRDGKELFFVVNADPDVMMAVNMTRPDQPGKPVRLFAMTADVRMICNPVNCYAVGTGARQFVTTRNVPVAPRPVKQINLVVNWVELTRR